MTNKRTCLYDKHVALDALITPFAGFDMPIQYTGIIDEHNAVREQWEFLMCLTWERL